MHDNKEKNNPVNPKKIFSEYPKKNANTVHQQVEDELKISAKQFRNIVEGTKAILFNVNTHGIFTYLNEAACNKLEMTNQELLGKIYLRFVHPENRAKVHSIFSEQIKNPTPKKSVDVQVITKSGKDGWISFLINPIYREGNIVGLSSVGQDITERKLAEAELSENERKTRALLDAIPDMIFRMNREGTYLDFKADKSDLYAQSEKTIIGKKNRDITPPEFADLVDRYIQQTLDSGEIQEFEYQMSTPKRGLRDYEARMVVSGKDEVIAVVRDITDRKQAEDSLRLFRTLIDKSNDAIEVVDTETAQFIDVNERACTDLGYSRSELLSMKIFDIDPGQTPEIFRSLMDKFQLSSSTIVESLHQRKDGSTFPVEINVTIVKLEKMYTISIVRDITERKMAENRLRRSEEQLKEAQQVGHIGSWELDVVKNTGTISDEMYKIFDLNSSIDVTIDTFLETPIPEDRERVREIVMKSMETLEGIDFDFRTITQNGEIRWVHEKNTIELDDKRNPIRVFGTCQDITESKLFELKLKESEEQYRSVAQSANDAIITSNIEGTILGWNKGAEKIFGYTKTEITGKNLNMIMPRVYIEQHNNGMKRIEQNGEHHVIGKTVELYGLHKSGKEFPLELSLAEWESSKEKFYTGIIRDITERRQAEEKIKESNNKLIKLNAEKDKFFSIIAHDLKSPFNGFLNLTELMADKTEEFSQAEFVENSKALNESARRLYKLLENLLEWAQMQKGSISFVPEEINLSTIISQNIEIISQRALQKGIAILNEVPASERVYADNKMVDTVFRNLLSNAVKFTKKDGKVIIKSKKAANGMVEVSVSDTGVGIPEKDVRRLFKIEEKVSSKGTDGESSTGLGLLLCKDFIEKNGGKIWVECEKGKGTIFYFTIPSFPINIAI